jgi:hypothetical protein
VTEKNWEHGKELLLVFVDNKKAGDSVKREEIWKSLEKTGTATGLWKK